MCSCKDFFPSGERPVIFHLNAYKYFCLSLSAPSASRHFKMRVLLFPLQPQTPVILIPIISHLMPAVMFMVFIPPIKALHFLLFPYLHSYFIFSFLDQCGPAICFTTRAAGSPALPTVAGIRAWRETLLGFLHSQKPQLSKSLELH